MLPAEAATEETAEASKSTTPSKADPPAEKVNKKRGRAAAEIEGEAAPEAKVQAQTA